MGSLVLKGSVVAFGLGRHRSELLEGDLHTVQSTLLEILPNVNPWYWTPDGRCIAAAVGEAGVVRASWLTCAAGPLEVADAVEFPPHAVLTGKVYRFPIGRLAGLPFPLSDVATCRSVLDDLAPGVKWYWFKDGGGMAGECDPSKVLPYVPHLISDGPVEVGGPVVFPG